MKLSVADNIKNLVPYPPGKPLEELEREYGITGSIKMASNENALGPSPKATAAIADALGKLHRYPDGSCYYLTNRLADKLGVGIDEIVIGNGSNEIIELLVNTFLAPDEEVITSHPTFLVYQKMVQARGGVNRIVPLKDMTHDLAGILAVISDKTRLIFLDNPNNPTGTIVKRDDFDSFLRKVPENVIVVLDEAYVDFVAPGDRIDGKSYLHGKVPVVILRTFSKAYGLAGLRIGYGIMPAAIASFLHRLRQPFNVNMPAQVGALAALDDEDHYRKTLEMTREGIDFLARETVKLGCRPFPTHSNFFLLDVGVNGDNIYRKMLSKGVIVRPMDAYGYPDYIRITVGLPAENERLLKALAATLREHD